jgi:hypothetical protein
LPKDAPYDDAREIGQLLGDVFMRPWTTPEPIHLDDLLGWCALAGLKLDVRFMREHLRRQPWLDYHYYQ